MNWSRGGSNPPPCIFFVFEIKISQKVPPPQRPIAPFLPLQQPTVFLMAGSQTNKFDLILALARTSNELLLDLRGHGLGAYEDRMSELVDALNGNEAIQILNLTHNQLTDRSAEQLSRLLHVEYLYVSHNNITAAGVEKIWSEMSKRPHYRILVAQRDVGPNAFFEKRDW